MGGRANLPTGSSVARPEVAYFARDTTTPITLSVEEFNISTPSLVFLALFIQARIWTKLPLQTITGAIPKNLKLE